jgi:hypothetical protein
MVVSAPTERVVATLTALVVAILIASAVPHIKVKGHPRSQP